MTGVLVVEGPGEGVVRVHVVQEVDTVDGGQLLGLLGGGGEQEAGLEAVQLVLGVEVAGEGGAGGEEEAEHQVEPQSDWSSPGQRFRVLLRPALSYDIKTQLSVMT